ncbi:transporter substrate-binding domain-containing protein [Pelomonas sp. V22]|uniref:substrate-binding periplasmic protein n=1 Tax=Pelomonas sp. V22 TaxID=2822139 RepID=UPI0024A99821|nr:transporter substrate-binding domain-containing protein [Pelomonas sp. V22]MDI4633653.1 transporter substrate-binding domain-containing protein [Pelomonas sp. V22]
MTTPAFPARRLATLGLLGLALPPLQAAPGRSLRMVRSEWPPYLYTTGGRQGGLDVELIEAVLQRAGCKLVMVDETPRRRRIQMIAAGELDLVPAATPAEHRQAEVWFTAPYRQEWFGLLSLASRQQEFARLNSFSELITRRLTVLAPKFRMGGEFDSLVERLSAARLIEHYDSARKGLAMLQRDRGALILGDIPTQQFLGQAEGTPLTRVPLPEQREPVSLMLSRQTVSAELLAQINAAIAALEADGTLPVIRKRYGF